MNTLHTAKTFDNVLTIVRERENDALPDRVVHVSDLRMTQEGHIALPGGVVYSLNDHARANLSTMLGLRWDRWAGSHKCASNGRGSDRTRQEGGR